LGGFVLLGMAEKQAKQANADKGQSNRQDPERNKRKD
jgi:hypothetical protein